MEVISYRRRLEGSVCNFALRYPLMSDREIVRENWDLGILRLKIRSIHLVPSE